MTPAYQVRVWQDEGWWLARVTGASDGANPAPLNALTQARTLTRIEAMGRDLIATVLDADEASFEMDVEYDLPGDAGDLVRQARGARAWLDAARDLWHERSAVAARALADRGYSLRDAATLLRLSHQRVDQLLDSGPERRCAAFVVLEYPGHRAGDTHPGGDGYTTGVEALLVLRQQLASGDSRQPTLPASELEARFGERIQKLLADMTLDYAQAREPSHRKASA